MDHADRAVESDAVLLVEGRGRGRGDRQQGCGDPTPNPARSHLRRSVRAHGLSHRGAPCHVAREGPARFPVSGAGCPWGLKAAPGGDARNSFESRWCLARLGSPCGRPREGRPERVGRAAFPPIRATPGEAMSMATAYARGAAIPHSHIWFGRARTGRMTVPRVLIHRPVPRSQYSQRPSFEIVQADCLDHFGLHSPTVEHIAIRNYSGSQVLRSGIAKLARTLTKPPARPRRRRLSTLAPVPGSANAYVDPAGQQLP